MLGVLLVIKSGRKLSFLGCFASTMIAATAATSLIVASLHFLLLFRFSYTASRDLGEIRFN